MDIFFPPFFIFVGAALPPPFLGREGVVRCYRVSSQTPPPLVVAAHQIICLFCALFVYLCILCMYGCECISVISFVVASCMSWGRVSADGGKLSVLLENRTSGFLTEI